MTSGEEFLKALRAAKKPVGKMSAMRTSFFSSIPGGAVTAVASARGTRRYSACPPGRRGEPKRREFAQREETGFVS